MIINFFIGVAVICLGFALLCWISDKFGGQENIIDTPPEKEFEASPHTRLRLVYSAPRETTVEEKRLLHEIHSEKCCTLYDQATNSHV